MRSEIFIDSNKFRSTPDEKWQISPKAGHWYRASTDFALQWLGLGRDRACLVVGSPLQEAAALQSAGWKVTYLDVREPPVEIPFIKCDASKLSLDSESFDALSSACVLTHVGLGRYGDPIVKDGDEKAIMEFSRVMKHGAGAAITFGAVYSGEVMATIGADHRIYSVEEAKRMIEMAGFLLVDLAVWDAVGKRWREEGEPLTDSLNCYDYLSAYVEKP